MEDNTCLMALPTGEMLTVLQTGFVIFFYFNVYLTGTIHTTLQQKIGKCAEVVSAVYVNERYSGNGQPVPPLTVLFLGMSFLEGSSNARFQICTTEAKSSCK